MRNARQEKKMIRQICEAFDRASKREYDINNWYMVKDNPISRAGVFEYRGSSMAGAMYENGELFEIDSDKIYKVLRSPEALSDPEFIESLKLKPWIDEHIMIGGDYLPAEEKGVEGVIGEQVYFADDTLYANLQLFSSDLAKKIDEGKKELSLGYRCNYIYKPGVYKGVAYDFIQRDLCCNHLASVVKGRMGARVAVLDHEDQGILDMKPEEVKAIVAEALDSALEPVVAKVTAMQTAFDESEKAKKEADSKEDKKVDDEADKKSTGMDADELAKLVDGHPLIAQAKAQLAIAQDAQDRSEKEGLYSKLSVHTGAFDYESKSLDDVVNYGIEKLSVACDSEDAEVRKAVLKTALAFKPHSEPAAFDSADKQEPSTLDKYIAGEV